MKCGCRVINAGRMYAERIIFCRLHGSAEELRSVIAEVIKGWDDYEIPKLHMLKKALKNSRPVKEK